MKVIKHSTLFSRAVLEMNSNEYMAYKFGKLAGINQCLLIGILSCVITFLLTYYLR